MVNTQSLINRALEGLDYVGFQLEALGVTDKVNRHNVIAFIFAEQKNLEGQIDSFNAKVGTQKVRLERLRDLAEKRVQEGVELALIPARTALDTLNSLKARLG
ncbi:MAG: hypothetical protein IPM37_10510 [Hahellaceae bacterium]|nr:hypothetical protein [Hahellaceae bacterium]